MTLPFRGRRTTPVFSFRLVNSELTVEHAQIEVDAGFAEKPKTYYFKEIHRRSFEIDISHQLVYF